MMPLYMAGDCPQLHELLIVLQSARPLRTVRSEMPAWLAMQATTAARAALLCLVSPALVIVFARIADSSAVWFS